MINGTKINLLTPRIDTKFFSDRFPFFEYNKKYIDKIYYYNSAGILVKDIFKEEIANKIYNYKIFFLFPLYIFHYIFIYNKIKNKFKADFIADFIFYSACRWTLLNDKSVYIKVFEFNKFDYIYNSISARYGVKTIYCLHTIKSLNLSSLKFLNKISENGHVLMFLVPSLYHKKIIALNSDISNIEIFNYIGHSRVPVNKELKYDENGYFILILNGSDSDHDLLLLAKKIYGSKIIVRPHPLVNIKHNMSLLDDSINFASGVLYNASAAVLLKEYINLPKYYIDLSNDNINLLGDIIFLDNIDNFIINQKNYIEEFFNFSCSKDVYKTIGDVLHDSDNTK